MEAWRMDTWRMEAWSMEAWPIEAAVQHQRVGHRCVCHIHVPEGELVHVALGVLVKDEMLRDMRQLVHHVDRRKVLSVERRPVNNALH